MTARTAGGHRRYTETALTELGLLRDEIALGHPPAKAARRVRAILDDDSPHEHRVARMLVDSVAGDVDRIRAALDVAAADLGLAGTIDGVVLPVMRKIGSWWETGRCDVGAEQVLVEVLRAWFAKLSVLRRGPVSHQLVLLAVGPHDRHTVGVEALATLLTTQGTGCRVLAPPTSTHRLVDTVVSLAPAAVVLVSHRNSHRRAAVETLDAVGALGCPTYFAGNAFLLPRARLELPGTYLGESIGVAAAMIRAGLPAELPPTGLAPAV